jgi:hypothetical protein
MNFTVKEEKAYSHSVDKVQEAINGTVKDLEAKITL